ncbi:hypothetical protein AHR24_23395 [Salmonella enterica subsp. diarizonae]|uniref:Fimbrial-type adhesion domain-containing protein n=1 Tax=Salmonella enteritidis TaxID=149539 RepID=A0A403FLX6_SALEN|nr:hypothetical protein [Salmonella enterica subsp. diarizonae]EED4924944.1 hypothetical protein [Salmonella enterica subsp. arizonae]EGX4307680.1 hypothetical protein [Salmonella enterica]MJY20974.1 hypothetical protein [Salmonella enterica subsp. enterica serovar Enteritidis]ECO0585778.1 hypothetical protein [Salmonella enterica subsp. diarizonae]
MKYRLFRLFSLSVAILLSAAAQADSFGTNQVGGRLTSQINMTVGTPTCSLDKGNETVDFSDITLAQLRAASEQRPVGVTLSCDSVPAGITLTMVPAGGSTADNVATPGVVTGSLAGTGYKLTWADGSAFGNKDSAVEYNVPQTVQPARITVLKMNVTPVLITSGSVMSGISTATINMVLNFS